MDSSENSNDARIIYPQDMHAYKKGNKLNKISAIFQSIIKDSLPDPSSSNPQFTLVEIEELATMYSKTYRFQVNDASEELNYLLSDHYITYLY